jgi:hypothetical protein
MDDDRPRIPAARWVIALGRCWWALLVCAAAWSLLVVVVLLEPVALLVPVLLAGYAAVWRALVEAFAAHRRGAWHLLLAVTALGVLAPWVPGSVSVLDVVSVAGNGTLLAFLLHRDSRDWVSAEPVPVPRRVPRVPRTR